MATINYVIDYTDVDPADRLPKFARMEILKNGRVIRPVLETSRSDLNDRGQPFVMETTYTLGGDLSGYGGRHSIIGRGVFDTAVIGERDSWEELVYAELSSSSLKDNRIVYFWLEEGSINSTDHESPKVQCVLQSFLSDYSSVTLYDSINKLKKDEEEGKISITQGSWSKSGSAHRVQCANYFFRIDPTWYSKYVGTENPNFKFFNYRIIVGDDDRDSFRIRDPVTTDICDGSSQYEEIEVRVSLHHSASSHPGEDPTQTNAIIGPIATYGGTNQQRSVIARVNCQPGGSSSAQEIDCPKGQILTRSVFKQASCLCGGSSVDVEPFETVCYENGLYVDVCESNTEVAVSVPCVCLPETLDPGVSLSSSGIDVATPVYCSTGRTCHGDGMCEEVIRAS